MNFVPGLASGAAAETAYLDRTAFWAAEFENGRAGTPNLALNKPAVAGCARATVPVRNAGYIGRARVPTNSWSRTSTSPFATA